jgi:hypothetical protein
VSYRVVWHPSVRREVQKWVLSDQVLVEVYLRIGALSDNPAERLVRTTQPFDGMVFAFEFVDPANRICVHYFAFLVQYSQDEESLIVSRGSYARKFG